jgi:hypothetical protein
MRKRKDPSSEKTDIEPDLLQPVALIPYSKGTSDKVGRLLRRHNIRTIFTPPKNALRPVKDLIRIENPGVYKVPCGGCEALYIGETGQDQTEGTRACLQTVATSQVCPGRTPTPGGSQDRLQRSEDATCRGLMVDQ